MKPDLKRVIEAYGYPVISKEVAHRIYYARKGSTWAKLNLCGLDGKGNSTEFNKRFLKWRFLMDAPFPISALCCNVMKKTPIHRFTKESGAVQIVGTMACESVRRQNAYLKNGCNAFHKREPTSQPMSFWTEQDVLEYLKLTGIPYASIYGDIVENGGRLATTGAQRTGCMFCMFGAHLEKSPNRFQRMALTHPKQYEYCIHKLGCGRVLDYIGVPYTAGKEATAHEQEAPETP